MILVASCLRYTNVKLNDKDTRWTLDSRRHLLLRLTQFTINFKHGCPRGGTVASRLFPFSARSDYNFFCRNEHNFRLSGLFPSDPTPLPLHRSRSGNRVSGKFHQWRKRLEKGRRRRGAIRLVRLRRRN